MQIHKSLSKILSLPLIATAVICLSHMAWGDCVVTNPLPGSTEFGSLGRCIASESAGGTITFNIDTVSLNWGDGDAAAFRALLATFIDPATGARIFPDGILNCNDSNLGLLNITQPSGCCYLATDPTNPGVCIIRSFAPNADIGLLEAAYPIGVSNITINADSQQLWELRSPKIVIDASNNTLPSSEVHTPVLTLASTGASVSALSIINDDRTAATDVSEAAQRAGLTTLGPIGGPLIHVTGEGNRIERNNIGLRDLLPVAPSQYTILAGAGLSNVTIGIQIDSAINFVADNIIADGGYGVDITSGCGNEVRNNCLGTLADCLSSKFNAVDIIYRSICPPDNRNIILNNTSGACDIGFITREGSSGAFFDTNYLGVTSDGTPLDTDPTNNVEYRDERGNFITPVYLCPTVEVTPMVIPPSAMPDIIARAPEGNPTTGMDIRGTNHTATANHARGQDFGLILNGYDGGNTISDNTVSDTYWGTVLNGNGFNSVTRNTFENAAGAGVFVDEVARPGDDGGTAIINENTFRSDEAGYQMLVGTIFLPALIFGGNEYNSTDRALFLFRTGNGDLSRTRLAEGQFDVSSNLLQGDLLSTNDRLHAVLARYTWGEEVFLTTCYVNDGVLEFYGVTDLTPDMCRLVADPCMDYILDIQAEDVSCDAFIADFIRFDGRDVIPKDRADWAGITTNSDRLTSDSEMWDTISDAGVTGVNSITTIVVNNTFEGGGTGILLRNSTDWRIGQSETIEATTIETSCEGGNTFVMANLNNAIQVEHVGDHVIRCNTFDGTPGDEGFIVYDGEEGGPRTDMFQRICMGSSCRDIDQLTAIADINERVIFDVYRADSDDQVVLSGTSVVSGGFVNGTPINTLNVEATGTTLADAMNQPNEHKMTYTTGSGTSDYIPLPLSTTNFDASGGAKSCSLIRHSTAASGISSHSTRTGALAGAMVIFLLIISPAAALALVRIRRRRP